MFRKRFLSSLLPVVTVLLLTLAACGSSSPIAAQPAVKSPAGVKIDACKLLTKADAEKLLGKAADAPTHPVQGTETYYVDSCEYRLTGGSAMDNATLTVEVPTNGDLASAQAAFNTGKQQAQAAYNTAPVDVPGFGDAAYWVAGGGNTLLVMKGSITFTLSASTQKGIAPSLALLDVAKTVLRRLP